MNLNSEYNHGTNTFQNSSMFDYYRTSCILKLGIFLYAEILFEELDFNQNQNLVAKIYFRNLKIFDKETI